VGGNEHKVINGFGLVSCLYSIHAAGRCWVLDYRLYDLSATAKSKLERRHAASLRLRDIAFGTVLMDGQTSKDLMLARDVSQQRQPHRGSISLPRATAPVDGSNGQRPYRHVCDLEWSRPELTRVASGSKDSRLFPKDKGETFFSGWLRTAREWIVANDPSGDLGAQQACAFVGRYPARLSG